LADFFGRFLSMRLIGLAPNKALLGLSEMIKTFAKIGKTAFGWRPRHCFRLGAHWSVSCASFIHVSAMRSQTSLFLAVVAFSAGWRHSSALSRKSFEVLMVPAVADGSPQLRPRMKGPRGGCRRAQCDESHFAKYDNF
jgi:hypothetical protein